MLYHLLGSCFLTTLHCRSWQISPLQHCRVFPNGFRLSWLHGVIHGSQAFVVSFCANNLSSPFPPCFWIAQIFSLRALAQSSCSSSQKWALCFKRLKLWTLVLPVQCMKIQNASNGLGGFHGPHHTTLCPNQWVGRNRTWFCIQKHEIHILLIALFCTIFIEYESKIFHSNGAFFHPMFANWFNDVRSRFWTWIFFTKL